MSKSSLLVQNPSFLVRNSSFLVQNPSLLVQNPLFSARNPSFFVYLRMACSCSHGGFPTSPWACISTGYNEISTGYNEISTDFNEISTDFNRFPQLSMEPSGWSPREILMMELLFRINYCLEFAPDSLDPSIES